MSGTEVCSLFQAWTHVPVFFLTCFHMDFLQSNVYLETQAAYVLNILWQCYL